MKNESIEEKFIAAWIGFTYNEDRAQTCKHQKIAGYIIYINQIHQKIVDFDFSKIEYSKEIPNYISFLESHKNIVSKLFEHDKMLNGSIFDKTDLQYKIKEFEKAMDTKIRNILSEKETNDLPESDAPGFIEQFCNLVDASRHLDSYNRKFREYTQAVEQNLREIKQLNSLKPEISTEQQIQIFKMVIGSNSRTTMSVLFELFPDILSKCQEIIKSNSLPMSISKAHKEYMLELSINSNSKKVIEALFQVFPNIISECKEIIDVFGILKSVDREVFKLLVEKGGLETFQKLFDEDHTMIKLLYIDDIGIDFESAAQCLDKLYYADILPKLLRRLYYTSYTDKSTLTSAICRELLTSEMSHDCTKIRVHKFLEMYKNIDYNLFFDSKGEDYCTNIDSLFNGENEESDD